MSKKSFGYLHGVSPTGDETLDRCKEQYPELYDAIYERGLADGKAFRSRVDTSYTESREIVSEAGPVASLTDEGIRAEWNANAALQAEFMGDFDAYKAYAKAVSSGHVSILGGVVKKGLREVV